MSDSHQIVDALLGPSDADEVSVADIAGAALRRMRGGQANYLVKQIHTAIKSICPALTWTKGEASLRNDPERHPFLGIIHKFQDPIVDGERSPLRTEAIRNAIAGGLAELGLPDFFLYIEPDVYNTGLRVAAYCVPAPEDLSLIRHRTYVVESEDLEFKALARLALQQTDPAWEVRERALRLAKALWFAGYTGNVIFAKVGEYGTFTLHLRNRPELVWRIKRASPAPKLTPELRDLIRDEAQLAVYPDDCHVGVEGWLTIHGVSHALVLPVNACVKVPIEGP